VRAKYSSATTSEDEAAAEAMNAYWVAFARRSDPNGDQRPVWPPFVAEKDVIMDFVIGGPVAKPDPLKSRLDAVEALESSRQ